MRPQPPRFWFSLLSLTALAAAAVAAIALIPDGPIYALIVAVLFAGVLLWHAIDRAQTETRSLRPAPQSGPRRLLSFLLWGAVQLAIVGLCLWAEVEIAAHEGRAPNFGLPLFFGVTVAFVLTALPFIVKDLIVGQWQHWSGKWRSRQHPQRLPRR